jgi:hypothetical protein
MSRIFVRNLFSLDFGADGHPVNDIVCLIRFINTLG